MSDQIAVMNAGKILQLGDPQEIYEHPRDRFVADFIGETNMLRGADETVEGTHATVMIPTVGQIRAKVADSGLSGNVGETVDSSIRPERISIYNPDHLQSDLSPGNRLDGTIVDAIYLGTHSQLVVHFADGQSAVVHLQNKALPDESFAVGQRA